MNNKCKEFLNKKSSKLAIKIIGAILIIITIVQGLLASIGISSLTGNYNYFIFTTLGMALLIVLLVMTCLIILIKRKISVF